MTFSFNAGDVSTALWLAPYNFYGSNNFTVMYPNVQHGGTPWSVRGL